MARILWINPVGTNAYDAPIAEELRREAASSTRVDEFQADPAATQQRILDEAERAVRDDGADAVVLGCTIEFGFYREVQDKIGAPAIDAVTAPLRYAEFLAGLGIDHGWRTSRVGGYDSVPARELEWIPVVAPVIDIDQRP